MARKSKYSSNENVVNKKIWSVAQKSKKVIV